MTRRSRLAGAALAAATTASLVAGCGVKIDMARPVCGTTELSTVALVAQSVRSASLVPCLLTEPTGWKFEKMDVRNSGTEMILSNDRGGEKALTVRLDDTCDTNGAIRVPSDEPGTTRYERVERITPNYVGTRFYVFDGGCVSYQFELNTEQSSVLINEASIMLGFVHRTEIRKELDSETGGVIENGP